MTSATESRKKYLVHFDEESWGAYPFPLNMVDVILDGPMREALALGPFGSFRWGRDDDGGNLRVHGSVTHLGKDGRAVAGDRSVTSWFRMPRHAAPMVLFIALPRFWTSRFPFTRETRPIPTEPTFTVSLADAATRRAIDRKQLAGHAASLQHKAWAIRYHRSAFYDAITSIEQHRDDLGLLRASAEYNAIDACAYALLDELATVISLMQRMRGGKPITTSFRKLYEAAQPDTTSPAIPAGLRKVLTSADWFGTFHARRSLTTHGCAAICHLPEGHSEAYIFQHPSGRDAPGFNSHARSEAAAFFRSFDRFLEELSIALLRWFHPWDTVEVVHMETVGGARQDTLVWVRQVLFSEDAVREDDGWAVLGPTGDLRYRTDQAGRIHGPPSNDRSTAETAAQPGVAADGASRRS